MSNICGEKKLEFGSPELQPQIFWRISSSLKTDKQATEYMYIYILPYKMDKGLCIRDGVNHPKIENRVQAHQQNEAELIQKRQCMQKKWWTATCLEIQSSNVKDNGFYG